MGRLYKITPPCPKCHEEHNWWHIQLTDEEQAKMDAYVAASEGKSSLELLLGEPEIRRSRIPGSGFYCGGRRNTRVIRLRS